MRVTLYSILLGLGLLAGAIAVFGELGAYLGFLLRAVARSAFAVAEARRHRPIRLVCEGRLLALAALVIGIFIIWALAAPLGS